MPSVCARRWYCASSEGSPCDCTGQPPPFLASWLELGLGVEDLPAWRGRRQFHRSVENVETKGEAL